jgi:acyl-CoA reductase-like NAD-dependent aldehyde dehydrogenase
MMSLIEVRNPRNGEVDYRFDAASVSDVVAVVRQARLAQIAWSENGLDYRIEVLTKFANAVRAAAEPLREALTVDTGRAKISAEEVDAVYYMLLGHSGKAREMFSPVFKPSSHVQDVDFHQQYVPYGVVGVISPWNFPLVLSFIDAIPALIAGNSVVMKPSEVTPRFVDPLQDIIATIPELHGVLSVIRGEAQTGQALIDNVDLIVFTGSISTGRKIAQAAASKLIPCFLELGGKDPAVVMKGADLDRAATSIIRSAVYNSGQVCYAIERVYVHETDHDELVSLLAAKSKDLDINYPDLKHGMIGPFIFQEQSRIINGQLEEAQRKGARIHCGGVVESHGGGLWMRATVLDNVDHTMRIMTEETFGPVIPVMRFSTEDEAVALANDSVYGLSAAVCR